MSGSVRSTIQKRDAKGRVRHGGEWLAIWADPDSLKSDSEKRADAAEHRADLALRDCIIASARSLAAEPGLELAPQEAETPEALRARGDAAAARHRFHDEATHAAHRPGASDQARIYDLIEHARYVGLAGRAYPGLVENARLFQVQTLARSELLHAHLAALIPMAEALRMVLRDTYAGLQEPSIHSAGFRMWDRWLRARFEPALTELADRAGDQPRHAVAAKAFVAALFRELTFGGERERKLNPSAPEDTQGDEDAVLREANSPPQAPLFLPGSQHSEVEPLAPLSKPVPSAPPPYHAYTTRHDRVVDIDEIFDRTTLRQARAELDGKRQDERSEVARLAAKLQRKLLARQTRRWEFDLDEGMIDASRLDRVVLSPGFASAYKQEAESLFRDTLVTLLIDNSGSMRGKPIETACLTADIVAAALDRCAIHCEILGFTTSGWKGGQAARDWKQAGRPAEPGRLGDLLHIVYKDANTPARRARDGLAGMLSPALLKENIDGEALLWAAGRMLARPEPRKLLIVISDGAPADEATLQNNSDPGLLDRHLRDVIATLTRQTSIGLAAIGLKHDVGQYYENAVRIDAANDLAPALIGLIDGALAD